MSEMINPYIAGAPVTETRMFFGREDVFDWIQNSLSGRYADHILVIHGQRRVGKTSVLKQLGNRLPEKYIPVFFDLQGRTHTTLDRFLWWLARETVRVLKQARNIELPLPNREDFARDPDYFETTFLPSLKPALGHHNLLFTFDEFDNLEESEIKEELARPLIDYLRRLIGREDMNFIFSIGSSGRKLENMQASYTEFFKSALYKKISFLTEEQTYQLVTRPVEGMLEYDANALKYIFSLTSGHPYFTQLICHEITSRFQNTEQPHIKKGDIDVLLTDVVERGTVNLKFTWDEASAMERWIMVALARTPRRMKKRALANQLREGGVLFNESVLSHGLARLQEKDVLTNQNDFRIHLMRLWLQENRSMDQVRVETGVNLLDKNGFERTQPSARRFGLRTSFIILGFLAVLIIGGLLGWPALAPMFQAPIPTQTLPPASPTATLFKSQTPTATVKSTVTPKPILGIGSTQVSEKDGMVMAYIPAGEFIMGSDNGRSNEKPVHQVYLDAYWIDQTEVTNSMYALCVTDGLCIPPRENKSYSRENYYSNPEFDNYPVIYMSWNDAQAYCEWAGRRLPSEAEWEKAASWNEKTQEKYVYPFSIVPDAVTCAMANYWGKDGGCVGDTIAVASYERGKSPYGVYDMAGNVWELVADWYSDTYYADSPRSNPLGPNNGQFRVQRGGSWLFNAQFLVTTGRGQGGGGIDIGFRCAQSISP
jgi:formylglycine-generating enzyme required for sulfatase activity